METAGSTGLGPTLDPAPWHRRGDHDRGHRDLTPLGWVSVLVLGLGCSAATYALWNWGVARGPASRAGVFLNLEPLVGGLVLGEAWGTGTVVGGALIIGAAVVVSRRSGV